MTDTITPTASGVAIPNPGTYEIDPTHSSATFQVRHLGLSKVRGSFERLSGTVTVADAAAASSAVVELEAASFTTGNEDRDNHVKSPDFLDVETHPTLTYRSTGVRRDGDDWKVDGELTIRDVTVPVTLDVDYEGAGKDPWGNNRIAFSARTEIDREQFGITWNQALETGGWLVGRNVKIAIDVQAVEQA